MSRLHGNSPVFAGRLLVAILLAAGALAPAFGAHDSEQVSYVPNVLFQFQQLTDRADALGFDIGDSPDPSTCYHYQGLARSTGPGNPYLFISKSGNQPPLPCVVWCGNIPCTEVGDAPGNLLVVRMESRPTSGERLRSNRLQHDKETGDTPPAPGDVVVRTIAFDGTEGWPDYGHAGGMQMIGDVLVVPLEHPYSGDQGINHVAFIDVSNPEDPRLLSMLPIEISDEFTAGAVGITRQPDGTYLLLVTGKDNVKIEIFVSNPNLPGGGTNLHDPNLTWRLADTWRPADEPVSPPCWTILPSPQFPQGLSWGWPSGGFTDYAHQSLNFVREGGPDGPLFLIGARNDNSFPGIGDDMLDLYEVRWDGTDFGLGCVAQRHLHGTASLDGALVFHNTIADFAAATGVYVSPSGELLFYATTHDNDGPSGSVEAGEWRARDMVRPLSPTYDPTAVTGGPYSVPEGSSVVLHGHGEQPATRAWIQLWNDDDYEDRYVVIDYDDRFLDDFDHFQDLDDGAFQTGYAHAASSLRYFAPLGCTIRLAGYRVVVSGTDVTVIPVAKALVGEDFTVGLPDLDDVDNEAGDGSLDDVITSVSFDGDCDAFYTAALDTDWDLDNDLAFETPGPDASFSAAGLDGPSTATVTLRVEHPVDYRRAAATTGIEITNVPPVMRTFTVTDNLGRPVDDTDRPALLGLAVTVASVFDDAGTPDTHVASVTWGDGTTASQADLDLFTPATGPADGEVRDSHAYAVKGTYPVTLDIADDDGGSVQGAANVRVVDAADLLGMIAQDIEDWIAQITDPAALRQLTDALRAIIGNQGGSASGGALDQLQADNLNATMVKIRDAVRALEQTASITGIDFDDEEGSLALVALSIAQSAYDAAVALAQPPTTTETRTLEDAKAALDRGNAALAAGNFAAAVDEFWTALQKVLGILTR